MKSAIPHLVVVAALVAPLFAGDVYGPASGSPTSGDSGFDEQSWLGAPHMRFGRGSSDTDLPGYPAGGISYTHKFSGNFDSLPGDVSSDQFSIYAPVLPINLEEFHLIAFVDYDATKFNTSKPNMLSEDTLSSFSLPVLFLHDISEKWIWGGMVMPTYAGNTSSSDSFEFSAALGAGYAFHDNLEVFAGAYYSTGFGEDDLYPGLAFIWRPAPRYEVFLLPPLGGVSYSVNEYWMVSLYGQYESPTWHVKADGGNQSRDINVRDFRVGLKTEFHLRSVVWGYLAGGYSLGQKLEVESTGNRTLQKSDVDASPYVEVGLNVRF